MSLEGLQPHPNLKALELRYYMGVTISTCISLLTNLVDLRLYNNKRLQHLPPLIQLLFLKSISLETMETLEYISKDSVNNMLGGSSSSRTTFFPSFLPHNRAMPKSKGMLEEFSC